MSIIYDKILGAKICLPIEMNIKLIFILKTSLTVKTVSYFVLPDHISPWAATLDFCKERVPGVKLWALVMANIKCRSRLYLNSVNLSKFRCI